MAGTQARIRIDGTDALGRHLLELARQLGDTGPVLDAIGGEVESQTRRRLAEDKEGPDGEAWPDWSPAYAATRRAGQSVLEASGHLIDSIHYTVNGNEAVIGSGLIYAAIHQFGGREVGLPIPARPYLGIGRTDRAEIEEVLGDWLGRMA